MDKSTIKKLQKLTNELFASCLAYDALRFYECFGWDEIIEPGRLNTTAFFPWIYDNSLYQPAISIQFAVVSNDDPDLTELEIAYDVSVERSNLNCMSKLIVLPFGIDKEHPINKKIKDFLQEKAHIENNSVGLQWRNLDDIIAWILYKYVDVEKSNDIESITDEIADIFPNHISDIYQSLEDESYFS